MSRFTTLFLATLAILLSGTAFADSVPSSGSVGLKSDGIDYSIGGVEFTEKRIPAGGGSNGVSLFGTATSRVVTISGTLKMSTYNSPANFTATINAYAGDWTKGGLLYRPKPEYAYEVPEWKWEGQLSNPGETQATKTQSFSYSIPLPELEPDKGINAVAFIVELTKEIPERYDPDSDSYLGGYTQAYRVSGYIGIPGVLEEKPLPLLVTNTGGQLDPLHVYLELIDNSTDPPSAMKDAVLKVKAPLPSKPSSVIDDFFTTADWSLSGYFKSDTDCPNCNTYQNQSRFTADNFFYYLETPGEPIEVLTDDYGLAELEFFLDLPALGDRGPRRDRPLKVPIEVRYYAPDGEDKGKLLAESKLEISLSHLGYVESVTYVQPQEWEHAGLGEYRLKEFHPGEFPLASYYKDQGTGLPYDDVRGADRARFTAANQLVAPGWGNGLAGGSLRLNAPEPSVQLQPGTLFSYGDRIDLDARGLSRLKPLDKIDPAYGITAKPGWVWVKVRFFDGLRAKVGVSGNCGQHALVFGRDPEESGWTPTGKAFLYWAGREATEKVVSKFIPIYGQVDLVCDMAGYINWANNATPHYIRVQSGFVVHREDDGGATVTVREGHPAVITPETGFNGVPAQAGQTVRISTGADISVGPTDPDQEEYADGLMESMLNAPEDTNLEPVETGGPSGFDLSSSGGEFPDGIVDIDEDDYADEGGDVPAIVDADGNEIIYPGEDSTTYRFDEFLMELEGDWDYEPETENSFAKLGNDDLILYMIILRTPATTQQMLDLLEFDHSEPLKITVAGRSAHWIPLFEDGEEFGSLLCFDEPLENGNNLYINFISGAEIWEGLRDDLVQITEGMRFLY